MLLLLLSFRSNCANDIHVLSISISISLFPLPLTPCSLLIALNVSFFVSVFV